MPIHPIPDWVIAQGYTIRYMSKGSVEDRAELVVKILTADLMEMRQDDSTFGSFLLDQSTKTVTVIPASVMEYLIRLDLIHHKPLN